MTPTARPMRPSDARRRPVTRRCAGVAVTLALGLALSPAASTVATPEATRVDAAPEAAHVDASTGESVIYAATVTDPDDAGGPLDIARVRHRIKVDRRTDVRIRYTVTTHESFDATRLDPRLRHFVIELNRDGERGSERNVMISYAAGHLLAEVISNATRTTIGTVAVARVDGRTLGVSGSRGLIGARSYFWTSNFHARRSTDCGQGDGDPITCQDTVPQRGWLRMAAPAWPLEGRHSS